MTVPDLESRYGKMVSLDELALFFHAHVRAVRNALDANKIPIFTFGRSTVVPLRLVEQRFGLQDVATDEDFLRHEAARHRSSYRPDGSPKPLSPGTTQRRRGRSTGLTTARFSIQINEAASLQAARASLNAVLDDLGA